MVPYCAVSRITNLWRQKEDLWLSMVVHTCDPSYSKGRSRRIMVKDQPDKSVRPYLKNKAKKAECMTQVVEYIPSRLLGSEFKP
jgi:hypothetical protein